MGFVDRLLGRNTQQILEPARSSTELSLGAYWELLQQFGFQGHSYTLPGATQEEPNGLYSSTVQLAYKTNGIVFACMLARMLLFAEARFQFRRLRSGRPGELWGSGELAVLERPWPGGTTGDLMSRAIQYADLGGNAFIARSGPELSMLRPDWVDIIIGSMADASVGAWDVAARPIGYVYYPGGKQSQKDPVFFEADVVAHFAPIPDPMAQFRGMSWLTPLYREIMADKSATDHKLAFFEHGAVVNSVIKTDAPDAAKYQEYVDMFGEKFAGASNAYKTLLLAAGWDYTPVGADFEQMDFKQVQGAGETRIAAAAGVPPIIVGLSEGLQAATYSNYGQARRRFADGTMSPLWRNMCGSLSRIINVPSDSELAVDQRDIPFLKEDQKDAAEILGREAATINTLVTAGFDPNVVVQAVVAGDLNRLVGSHSGLYSVQLQPPGLSEPPDTAEPAEPVGPAPRDLDSMFEELLRNAERERPPANHEHNIYVEAPAAPRVEFAEGAIRSEVTVEAAPAPNVEIAEGAIRSDVHVAPSSVEFAEGSIRSDVHVAPANVEFAEGAIRSDVTVEPARVEIAEGAVQTHTTVEPAHVDVTAPNVTVEPARVEIAEGAVHVTVEPTEIAEGAVQVNVQPAEVRVEPTINVEAAQPANVTVKAEIERPKGQKLNVKRDKRGNVISYDLGEAGKEIKVVRDEDGNAVSYEEAADTTETTDVDE